MNSVPFEFYESVTHIRLLTGDYSSSRHHSSSSPIHDAFPGVFREATAYKWENAAYKSFSIENEKLVSTFFASCHREQNPVEPVDDKHRLYTEIYIYASELVYAAHPEAVEAIKACRNHSDVVLIFSTSHLSSELEKSINSLRGALVLRFNDGSAGIVPRLMKMLVKKKTVAAFIFPNNFEIEVSTTELLFELLSQDQFSWIRLPFEAKTFIKLLIAYWKTNPEKLTGKHLIGGGLLELSVSFCTELREPSAQEEEHFQLYYPRLKADCYGKQLIMKRETEGAAYYLHWYCGRLLFV